MKSSSHVPSADLNAKIQEMVDRIVKTFHPDRVILFGSHARGEGGPDSDVDLLVVIPAVRSKREIRLKIRQSLNAIGVPKDIVVVTPEEVKRYKDVVGTIIRPALRDGVVWYERAA